MERYVLNTEVHKPQAYVLLTWGTGSELKPLKELIKEALSSQSIKSPSEAYFSISVSIPIFLKEGEPLQSTDTTLFICFQTYFSIACDPELTSCYIYEDCLS